MKLRPQLFDLQKLGFRFVGQFEFTFFLCVFGEGIKSSIVNTLLLELAGRGRLNQPSDRRNLRKRRSESRLGIKIIKLIHAIPPFPSPPAKGSDGGKDPCLHSTDAQHPSQNSQYDRCSMYEVQHQLPPLREGSRSVYVQN